MAAEHWTLDRYGRRTYPGSKRLRGGSSSRRGGRPVGFRHSPEVRARIRITHLLLRLQENAFGRLDPELTMRQIRSIEILLRKCLPDLSSITLVGDPERPIIHRIERVIIEAA